jgi:tetratricopeptide (TPR) repeat protein
MRMLLISLLLNSKFIHLYAPLNCMRSNGIVLSVIAIMLVTVLCSGCTGNNAGANPVMTPAPVPAAVDLHSRGFDAYIKGNYSTALDFYNQAITADPRYTRAWIDKGNVLVKLNRTSEAISSYDSALALENNLALVWNSRGEALMTIGNYTEARDSFDKALQIAPANAKAKENRDLALAKLK